MTAIYGSIMGNTLQLLTDGAVVDFDGILVSTKTKVTTSKLIPLAVTGRGSSEILDTLQKCVVGYSNFYGFDATLVWLEKTLSEMRAVCEEKGRLGQLDVIVAGLSESQGLGLWLISTHDHYATLPPYYPHPFALNKVPEIGFGPMPPAEAMAKAQADGGDPETIFKRHGADLLTAARSELDCDWHGGAPQVPLGGHVDLTVITDKSVTTERLITWPDVVGERLQIVP